MLTIRMRRVGAKKKPLFRVVVIESHAARDGAALEVLGHYNPTAQPETVDVDRQRLQYWVERGAQLSDTVRTLVGRHPETAAEPAPEPAAAAAETPAAEASAASAEAQPAAAADETPAADEPAAEPVEQAAAAAETEPAEQPAAGTEKEDS